MRLQIQQASKRKGLATLEVGMCLLILAVMLSGMFVVFTYCYAAGGIAVAARYHAWSDRYEPWQADSREELGRVSDPDYHKILGNNQRLNPNESITHEIRKHVSIFGVDAEIASAHYLNGGTWDHKEIPFDSHDRLVPSEKFGIFSRYSANWSRLQSFADFASAALVDEITSAGQAYANIGSQAENQSRLRGLIQQEIGRKEAERFMLRRRIRNLEQDEDADAGLLAELRRRLREVERQLSELREALSNLSNGSSAKPK